MSESFFKPFTSLAFIVNDALSFHPVWVVMKETVTSYSESINTRQGRILISERFVNGKGTRAISAYGIVWSFHIFESVEVFFFIKKFIAF